MKILFVTDPHGHRKPYLDLIEKVKTCKPDCLIFGGDLFPKIDYYGQRQFARDFFGTCVRRLKNEMPELRILLIFGNMDWITTLPEIQRLQDMGLVEFIHTKIVQIGSVKIFGYSFTPVSPFAPKDWEKFDTREQSIPSQPRSIYIHTDTGKRALSIDEIRSFGTIEDELMGFENELKDKEFVFVSHGPPYNTRLDITWHGVHVGSVAIKNFIMRCQPLISLHGHIHEASRISKSCSDFIGKTMCFNPGDSQEKLNGLLIDLENPGDFIMM
jgi:Icc-related predicted phosphoesterase